MASPQATGARIGVEPFQRPAVAALTGPAKHVLIYGGSGSGKTHTILTWIAIRAVESPGSTHACFRLHFSDLQRTIIDNTFPKVCKLLAPGRELYKLDRTAGSNCAVFLNGSRLYFGGLSDKQRTEKILGGEFSTIYLNETSQISYAAFNMATTRLREPSGLALKFVCDENPPDVGHWTERMWKKGLAPISGKALHDAANYAAVRMHPKDSPYISEDYKHGLEYNDDPRARVRFWEGEFGAGTSNPLWDHEGFERSSIDAIPAGVTLTRIIVAVDPSGCRGPEDVRSDEVGIVVEGLGSDGVVYVLEDASGRMGPGGEDGWGAKIIERALFWGADAVYGEVNFGGAMVESVLQTARYVDASGAVHNGRDFAFREIIASRGKTLRAEPVSGLDKAGRVKFVGRNFVQLRDQLLMFSTSGYVGSRSPDRADAFVHGAYALGVVQMPGQSVLDWYRQEYGDTSAGTVGARTDDVAKPATPAGLVRLLAPAGKGSSFCTRKARWYAVEAGQTYCAEDDVDDLLAMGFMRAPALAQSVE